MWKPRRLTNVWACTASYRDSVTYTVSDPETAVKVKYAIGSSQDFLFIYDLFNDAFSKSDGTMISEWWTGNDLEKISRDLA
jgi:hypothetical protein